MELLAVSIDVSILLEVGELVDEGLNHGLGTVGLVVLPRLTQGCLNRYADF